LARKQTSTKSSSSDSGANIGYEAKLWRRSAVKVIKHFGDEVMKAVRV
jgi:hypothetical protein